MEKSSSGERMCRIRELKYCFVYFYLFGQTTYIPLKGGHSKCLLIVSFLPKLIHLAVIITNIFSTYTQINRKPSILTMNTVMLYTIFTINCMSNIVAFYLNVLTPFWSRQICDMFSNIIQFAECKMLVHVPVYRFQKHFHKKIWFGIILEIISSSTRIIVQSPVFKPMMNVYLLIIFLYKMFVMLHALMYIDLIQFVLCSVNTKLNNVAHTRWHRYSVAITFRQVKWIHFNLWKISKKINQQLGWIIIMLILENSTYSSACVFWIFWYFETPTNFKKLYFLRKYSFVF